MSTLVHAYPGHPCLCAAPFAQQRLLYIVNRATDVCVDTIGLFADTALETFADIVITVTAVPGNALTEH